MNTATPTRIAVTPGDGIGPEVIHQSLRVLEHLRNQYGLVLEWDQLEWPSTDWHRRNDRMMPEDAMGQLAAYDAILLGALGDPGPSRDPNRYLLSDSVSPPHSWKCARALTSGSVNARPVSFLAPDNTWPTRARRIPTCW